MLTVVTRQHSHTSRNHRTQAIPRGTNSTGSKTPEMSDRARYVCYATRTHRVHIVNRYSLHFPSFAVASLSCVFLSVLCAFHNSCIILVTSVATFPPHRCEQRSQYTVHGGRNLSKYKLSNVLRSQLYGSSKATNRYDSFWSVLLKSRTNKQTCAADFKCHLQCPSENKFSTNSITE